MNEYKDGNKNSRETNVCRILVVGSSVQRVFRVVELLRTDDCDNHDVAIEYVPCVASFGSYKDENGDSIRYLSGIHHFDSLEATTPQSLLTFFDSSEQTEHEETSMLLFPSVSGVSIGCGIEGTEDTERIQSLLQTLSVVSPPPPCRTLQPKACYPTMAAELQAFRALSLPERKEVSARQEMGPHKMAKWVQEFVHELVTEAVEARSLKQATAASPTHQSVHDTAEEQDTVNPDNTTTAAPVLPDQHMMDPEESGDNNRCYYLCHYCRHVLFNDNDLENPPHRPAQHEFSYRKMGSSSSTCQSYFLAESLPWMDTTTTNDMEGKLACPFCQAKLGIWKWSGSQCSCGTWVVPALQFPKSKIDVVSPNKKKDTAAVFHPLTTTSPD